MKWLIVIIVVAVIGGIIGFLASDGEPGGFLLGALEAGGGCGIILLRIFIFVTFLFVIVKLFGWLFG